jgi:hypothetical protein
LPSDSSTTSQPRPMICIQVPHIDTTPPKK